MRGVIRSYRRTLSADRRRLLERFRYVHAARKVVGVGSVGTRAWIVLMLGRDEQRPAVPAAQGGAGVGARAVPGQERVQPPRPARRRGPAADAGGQRHHARLDPRHRRRRPSRDFYIRQLWDGKGSALVELMEPKAMTLYAELCGHALAKAHARSGDAIAIASYLGAERQLRPCAGGVRRGLRRPERARLRRAAARRSRPAASPPRPASDRGRLLRPTARARREPRSETSSATTVTR